MQGAYLGKDGKLHSTIEKKWEADARYEQHQEQKRLLEEQNRLLAQQNSINSQLEMKKLKNEELRILAEKSSHYKQMEHEENMRIFKLCDAVGIPKETLDGFREYLFAFPEELQGIENKKEYLDDIYVKMETAKSHLKDDDEDIIEAYGDLFPELDEMEKGLSAKREEKIKGQFEEWCNNPTEYEDELKKIGIYDIILVEKSCSKYSIGFFISSFLLAIIYIIMFACTNSDSVLVLIALLDLPITIFWVYYLCKWRRRPNNEQREEIKKLIEMGLDVLIYQETLKVNKIEPKKYLKDYIKDLENQFNNLDIALKKFLNNVRTKWENFTEFRKNHYNSKVEKLLIDVGLKDIISEFSATTNLELKYSKINVNNKIKDGSVEDYIAYFDELQD